MKEEEVAMCVAEIKTDLKWIKDEIGGFDRRFAPKLRFALVERLVYGLVGLVLMGVGSALVAGVIQACDYILKNKL